MNSREKGKRGELELSHILKEQGFDTRRGQQYCGSNGDADVVGIDGLHIECKRVEHLDYYKAYTQSCFDAKDGEMPVVMHRKDRHEWLVTLSLFDFLKLWRKNES